MPNIAAIVGRPNVGKSTLFNRLCQSRQAIVESLPGVTRDRHYGRSDWNGKAFNLIDTGGYVSGSDDVFEEEIRKQVELAIEEADVILFMVDAREGLTGLDEEVAQLLRKSKKPVFVLANKIDMPSQSSLAAEFYALGLEEVYGISAISGAGTGELLDAVVVHFAEDTSEPATELPRIAILGRPNVGKSSLTNALLGKERTIVTDVAGTTRDTIYTPYKGFGMELMLVDTAGLRKKGKIYENIEFYSVIRTVRALENADVCILMVDAVQGFESQDLNIFSMVVRNNKGIIIAVNKWDLIEKDHNTHKILEEEIRRKTSPFTDVPIVFISVKDKQRIYKIMDLAHQIYEKRSKVIPTNKLNELLLPLISSSPPPLASRNRKISIKYVTQIKGRYPQFAFFCNLPAEVKAPYKRFLENQIRELFDFTGVPIVIYFRQK